MTAILVGVLAPGMAPTIRQKLTMLNGQEYKILRHFYAELKFILDEHPGKVLVRLGILEDWQQWHKHNAPSNGVEYITISVDKPWED